MKRQNKAQRFVFRTLETILVIGYILFEELIWDVFAKPVFQYFKSLVALDALKKTFQVMNRYMVLMVFITILAITEIMGFASGFFIVNGHLFLGITIYTLKIPIAAFTFWLFDLTREKLMTFHWLKTAYDYIMNLVYVFTHSDIHSYIKERMIRLRSRIKQLSQKYFGKGGFVASVKTHYVMIRSYFGDQIKQRSQSGIEKKSTVKTKLDAIDP
jgi:hypothetical protein